MSELDNFIKAAEKGDLNTVQSLVDKVNVNSKNEGNETALYKAAAYGYLDVVRFLVARQDVDVNLADVRTKDCHHLMMCPPSLTLDIYPKHFFPILSLSFISVVALCMTSSFPLPNSLCLLFGCRCIFCRCYYAIISQHYISTTFNHRMNSSPFPNMTLLLTHIYPLYSIINILYIYDPLYIVVYIPSSPF